MNQKPPVGARINREHALRRGLVAYWPLNEGGGLYAHDQAQGAYNRADLTNGPAWAAGNDGPCLSFDGSNDYVKTTRIDVGLITAANQPHTYIAWVNPTLTGGGARHGVVGVGEFDDSNFSSVMVINPSTGELGWSIDPASTTVASGLNLTANVWQFIALVRYPTEVRFWVGSARATVSSSSSSGISNDPILFGAAGRNAAVTAFYTGKIGSVLVYNRAVSDQEVNQLLGDPYALYRADQEETGFVAAGAGTVTGTLSVTLADVTLSATATVLVSGTESTTLGAATGTSAGTVLVSGSESSTLGAATGTSTGTILVTGSDSSTLGAASASSTGAVLVTGSTSGTCDAVTCSASGSAGGISCSLSATLAATTVTATGTVTSLGLVTGTLNATLSDCTVNFSGSVRGSILYDEITATLREVEGTIEDVGSEISDALVELEGLL
jgi:hypothetical protein